MALTPRLLTRYHVFLASPGDVDAERQHVRRFFDDYNRSTAHLWNTEFQVIDRENCATIGVGRPQELITQQTLEQYRTSLALVVGIMGQRFGTPTGKGESGTEEEFQWAMNSFKATGFPEVKWFFRKTGKVEFPEDPDDADEALRQWKQVRLFRNRMQDFDDPVFYTEYAGADAFRLAFDPDLHRWLADPARPWALDHAARAVAPARVSSPDHPPAAFDAERYQAAIRKQFDRLNFEMLDTTGAFYSGVRLWSVFVPQSARECYEYNPRLLEIPKEHQQRLLTAGEITAQGFGASERDAEQWRRDYFNQPRRPVLDAVEEALRPASPRPHHRLLILGDPGSGKSSLIRYLALRWASIADRAARDTQPVPLVIDLGSYGRWQREGRKGLVRFLEEASIWHDWHPGVVERLLEQPNRALLLLDGLDEVFDLKTRDEVVNAIQRFAIEYSHTPMIVTSRAVGYQPQRMRDAEFRHFMLQDLDAAQIDAFVDRWHEQTFDDAAEAAPKRDRLKKAIQDSKSIAMLAGNPLLLTMMAILNRNQELPRDRVDLYSQASRVLLQQWDTERALSDFPGFSAEIGWREKSDILRRVASHMQAGPGGLQGNMIDGSTLTRLIEDYLHGELHFVQSRAAARAVVEHLRQRNFILCFVGADSYSFVHRTFLEYFCAADFVQQFNVAKTLNEDGLIALFDRHCRDDDWREVLRLICGQIDEQFVGRVVQHLAARTDLDTWDGDTALPEVPLAIWCLGEVRNSSRLEEAGWQLLQTAMNCFLLGKRPSEPFIRELVAAAADLGPRWPGRESFTLTNQYPASASETLNWRWPLFIDAVFGRRSWIEQLASCPSSGVRLGSIDVLTTRWPDAATRALVTAAAIDDAADDVRVTALKELAEKWPDETTRALLAARAVGDPQFHSRDTALGLLVDTWPDETTRTLLAARAVDDPHFFPRFTALASLVKQWPDESTRTLLTARAVADASGRVRRMALESLAEYWLDEPIRTLLVARARYDGFAASIVSRWHSTFGQILFTKDLDGTDPYLDPHRPIAEGHIDQAARIANVAADQIDATVRSLSVHLGWDITRGSSAVLQAT